MIPYAELERAINRWKARQSGGEAPAAASGEPEVEVGAVSEMFVDPGMSYEGHFSHDNAGESSSGVIQIGDADLDDQDKY